MVSVEIQLPSDAQAFVEELVASGVYDRPDEAIAAALRQMRDRSQKLESIRRSFLQEEQEPMFAG
jgi:putative addiction module CopG family antidote